MQELVREDACAGTNVEDVRVVGECEVVSEEVDDGWWIGGAGGDVSGYA